MFGIDFSEVLVIFAIALVVLGPEKLPKLAATIGRWIGRARLMARQFREQLDQEANNLHHNMDLGPEFGRGSIHPSPESANPTVTPAPGATAASTAPTAGPGVAAAAGPAAPSGKPSGTAATPGSATNAAAAAGPAELTLADTHPAALHPPPAAAPAHPAPAHAPAGTPDLSSGSPQHEMFWPPDGVP